jgi:hypothetical protein
VLLHAPGNPPEEGDASFYSCSKAYQANSSHLLKYKHNLALKSSAAMAAASTPPSDVVAPSTHDTRGLSTTQNKLVSKRAELAEAIKKLDEAHHELESKNVVELDTKLGDTQSELVSTQEELEVTLMKLWQTAAPNAVAVPNMKPKCTICLDENNAADTACIPCGHTFCEACIDGLRNNSGDRQTRSIEKHAIGFKCSICRKLVESTLKMYLAFHQSQ